MAGVDCDWCEMSSITDTCPGQDAHCALGQHCVVVTEVCSIDHRRGDHPRSCEHCGAVLAGAQ